MAPPLPFSWLHRVEKVLDQQRDVLATFSQWRYLDGDHVQSVIEILAEALLPDRVLQVLVGGGDDPDIHLDGLR